MNKIIALLTDFGERDGYVAAMKGVIYSISPDAKIIDISHEIESHNIEQGAFVLWNSYNHFPSGTVFAVVVDPGVGSSRKILCVQTDKYCFLAPDNGLLKYVIETEKNIKVFEIIGSEYLPEKISVTFHGRDIISPIAARLSKNKNVLKFGKPVKLKKEKDLFVRNRFEKDIRGKVIHIDKFGNIITNILIENPDYFKNIKSIIINRNKVTKFYRTYSEGKGRQAFGLIGSKDLLEISVKNQNAAKILKARTGSIIQLKVC